MNKQERKQSLDIIDWLLTHNKNYTKQQYYKLLDLEEMIKKEI